MATTTTILTLPNELLSVIVSKLDAVHDLAAVARTSRRLCSLANPLLYAAAARHDQTAGPALFHSVQNGFVASVRRLLSHGVDPCITATSLIPLEPLSDQFARSWLAKTLFYHRNSDSSAPPRPGLFHPSRHPEPGEPDFSGAPGSLRQQLWFNYGAFHWTALHIAAASGHGELVTLLLDAGADIDPLLRCWDQCAMMGAVEEAHSYYSNPPKFPQTPLGAAILKGQRSIADLLLSRGASTTVCDGDITALHSAAWQGDLELCRSLLDRAPHLLHAQTSAGLTPFHYAAASDHLEPIGSFLRDQGADIRAALAVDSFYYRGQSRNQRCDSMTQALRRRRYSTALALLDMDPGFATPGEDTVCPLETCLGARNITGADKQRIPAVFLRLFHHQGCISRDKLETMLAEASALHLPQTVGLLLDSANDPVLSNRAINTSLSQAFRAVRSPLAVETVMKLVDYRTTTLGRSSPGISSVFTGGRHLGKLPFYDTPNDHRLEFTNPRALEAALELATRLHDHLITNPGGVDPNDLRIALPSACQPGGLPVCEWLGELGALDRTDKHGFLDMLSGTALPVRAGGNDGKLAEWVIAHADKRGHKDWVLANCDVPHMIVRSDGCAVAIVAVRAGAALASPRSGEGRTRMPKHYGPSWPCQKLRRRSDGRISLGPARHVLPIVCARPELSGAEELLQLAVDNILASEHPERVINCALGVGRLARHTFTPASFVCCTAVTGDEHGAQESTRLALLKILLAAGAEVHATIKAPLKNIEAEIEDITQRHHNESIWTVLAWEAGSMEALPDPAAFIWKDDPIRAAIRSRMPTLVRAMLEARPLPDENTSDAALYLSAACGGDAGGPGGAMDRLSPEVLDIVLSMANLTDPDVPLDLTEERALMRLLRFFLSEDEASNEAAPHQCRCDARLLEAEAGHLTQMVAMLLGRGATWTVESTQPGRSALHVLRTLMKADWGRKSVYKEHNIAEFRKHIVLDLDSEAARTCRDFNPFEFGDIMATTGME